MWIVALAWIYVVLLMAATETSVVAGIMTFLGYCVLPLSIVFYITGSARRRARKTAPGGGTPAADGANRDSDNAAADGSGGNGGSGDGDGD
jgi:hypothetical protein